MKPFKGLIAKTLYEGHAVYCVFDKGEDGNWLIKHFTAGVLHTIPATVDNVFPCTFQHDPSFDNFIRQVTGVWPDPKPKKEKSKVTGLFPNKKTTDTTPVVIGKLNTNTE